MTIRYSEHITALGLATSGKAGARLAARLGIVTTRQTILRRIMDLPDPPTESILFLGIDDLRVSPWTPVWHDFSQPGDQTRCGSPV
jgi:hypothetical protein